MNAHWAPCFHADVAAALADAKLDWVASANLMENFPELMLTPEQRAVIERYKDPIMRELVKDMCLQRQLRHDVFVRGARRMYNDAARRGNFTPDGHADRQSGESCRPRSMCPPAWPRSATRSRTMMAAAMRGPATVGELLALERGEQPGRAGERAGGSPPVPDRDVAGQRAARNQPTGSTACSARGCTDRCCQDARRLAVRRLGTGSRRRRCCNLSPLACSAASARTMPTPGSRR